MPNITRPIARPGGTKTKILLVRPPAKSVRKADERDPAPLRLAIGVIATLGGVGAVWLMGHIGFRLGFCALVGLPELVGEPGGGLSTGALIFMTLPLRIFEAGVAEPLWLMVGFALIAIPGSALAGARTITPGGPKPSSLFVVLSWTGAIASLLAAAFFIAYVSSPFRMARLSPLSADLFAADVWLNDLTTIAGLDGLALVSIALWVVLAMRLATATWMWMLSASTTIFALVVVAVATAISSASVCHMRLERSGVAIVEGGTGDQLLVGYTRQHAVIMHTEGGEVRFEMFDVPTEFRLTERRSIADALIEGMPAEVFE